MGLDQYLYAEKYISNWNFEQKNMSPEEVARRKMFNSIVRATGVKPSNDAPSMTLKVNVGYWRKANAIHSWFVKNVQNGEDDCDEYHVAREKLEELLKLCETVLKAAKLAEGAVKNGWVASAKTGYKMAPVLEKGKVVKNAGEVEVLLPTQDGFFFGSTDYDEYYIQDVKDTVKILTAVLNNPKLEGWDFGYRASW